MVLWFTGISGAGKSTIAKELEKKLWEEGKQTMLVGWRPGAARFKR
jgi:bifunctional enzyme CysN/CysC